MFKAVDVELTTYCHATEDCDKVVYALKNLLPPDLRDSVRVEEQLLHGYYGNPIKTLYIRVVEKSEDILSYLSMKLSDTDKSILSATLDLRYDARSNKLYIRFSKQDAYNDHLTIYDSDDVIKLVISFKNGRGIDRLRQYLREKGLIK